MANPVRWLAKRLDGEAQAKLSKGFVEETEEMKLFRYGEDGKVDLDLYRQLQVEANKAKIDNQWVPEEHIRILSEFLIAQKAKVAFGLCHGTRRGNEQVWFRKYLGEKAKVIGTEISDTATQFPHTIQWDFHEVDPAWLRKTDFVYSNSWDHSYDPELAFSRWMSCLKKGGYLMLDHGWNYEPDRVSAMDPFGITEAGLVKMLDRVGAGKGKVIAVIDGSHHKNLPIRTVIYQNNSAAK